jgi:hypothetical protein
MLQAFIDDSRETNPPIFVLAGYLATAEQWRAFSTKWQEVLDMAPRMPYFKMSEARRLPREKRAERIGLFFSVIEEFISSGFSVMVPPDAITRVYGTTDKFARHPFYCAFSILIPILGLNIDEFGLHCDDIELYFDDQMHEKDRMVKAWDWAKSNATIESPKLKRILNITPHFCDDKSLLPLQAADLHAWWIRRRYVERATGVGKMEAPWRSATTIKYMQVEVTEEQLRQREFRRILSNISDGF